MREKKEINIQIGERVKFARENSNITQEQLAERIEVSPQYISDMERGLVGLSISSLKKVCLALNIGSDQILFGKNKGDEYYLVAEKCKSLPEKQFYILCDIIDKYIEAVEVTE